MDPPTNGEGRSHGIVDNDPNDNDNSNETEPLLISPPTTTRSSDRTTPVANTTTTNGSNNAGTPAPTSATREVNDDSTDMNELKKSSRMGWFFGSVLGFDILTTIFLLFPFWPYLQKYGGAIYDHDHHIPRYTVYNTVIDLFYLAIVRIVICGLAIMINYCRGIVPKSEYGDHVNLHHPNGDKKSRDELEQEQLEEPFLPWLLRYMNRSAFYGEWVAIATQILCIVKSLYRMNLEIGTYHDSMPYHPLFWLAILLSSVVSFVEAIYLHDICILASKYGNIRNRKNGNDSTNDPSSPTATTMFRTLSSQLIRSLSTPLLSDQDNDNNNIDVEHQPHSPMNGEGLASNGGSDGAAEGASDSELRGTSDITGDCSYKAQWTDLLMICYPDMSLLLVAFVFLLLAAIAQVYIPKFLGNILDSLAVAFSDKDSDDPDRNMSMWDVPGFLPNVKLLVIASVLAGVFAGARGSIFTVVGSRVNVRLRVQLMDALLSQDIGFFDVTKTGDITSRLSSDTTLVGDQVSLNVNVFLRSLVQAVGVLSFMFMVSWQLSIIAFVSVPLITIISKWYGNYIRALTKLMQTKLAEGNSVCEAALGSMSTVRAFDAAEKELSAFEEYMSKYLYLTYKSAIAYYGFATLTTSLPELVFAVVVYYGGMLVRNGDMTSGKLVSFLLYLQSLSDAFATIGWVFSSLTQAVGAADKVFELLHRKPKMKHPTNPIDEAPSAHPVRTGILGIEATKTRQQRTIGRRPRDARGEIIIENVDMYYPARPKRKVLNGLTLKIEPGSVVALVGQSGGGKSSVMSLIQHLYEPSAGRILLDGHDVHELCPEWLSRNISIVSQEPTLFARSIKKNIMYGLDGTPFEPSDDEIIEAAKLANAHNFIMDMPQKYDTEAGERGVQLSGGQKQRIAIARALVRKPRVLLLDEATSALDAESEHLVQQAIDGMIVRGKSKGSGSSMTVIIVAHRLSTVRSADRIFVIKEGQVVEEGSHDDLIENQDGPYSQLIRRQMEAQQQLDK